jgi:5-methylthioadenosine/S-adenosylhomocysteine deaminase
MTTRRTAIHAGWIIAFDGEGHRLLRDGVVVIEGERIVHVGASADGPVDETIVARDDRTAPSACRAGSPRCPRRG